MLIYKHLTCEGSLVEHPEEGEYEGEAVEVLAVIVASAPVPGGQGLVQAQVPVLAPVGVTWTQDVMADTYGLQ